MDGTFVTGIDGCPGGWIAATMRADGTGDVAIRMVPAFADLLAPEVAVIAVDMPIGLPDRIAGPGRGPEQAVRPLLGLRQSSVFSIPSRAALYASVGPFPDEDAMYAGHRLASEVARATSAPQKGVSIQAFHIFPKIREIDALLRSGMARSERIIEVHPEVAFWRLNGERSLRQPKKVKGRPYPEGIAERRALLLRAGLPAAAIEAAPPRGAATDDLIDALAALTVALRHVRGQTRPFPDPPERDSFGIPVAIWA